MKVIFRGGFTIDEQTMKKYLTNTVHGWDIRWHGGTQTVTAKTWYTNIPPQHWKYDKENRIFKHLPMKEYLKLSTDYLKETGQRKVK